jgi:hypothetical protein
LTPIFSGFIRDDPPHLRHPRSINPYIDVKTALGNGFATTNWRVCISRSCICGASFLGVIEPLAG